MEHQQIDLALIPFAMRRSDGEMVDVYSVKRGRKCGCICPSCKTPMIARQGPVREWHFAHATRQGGTENVCEYSALVSIRLMAHQVLANIHKMCVPPGPYEVSSFGREVTLDSVEIDARFEGQTVDAVATVKGTPLILYFSYKSRPIPNSLSKPANRKVGVLGIDLPLLWRQVGNSASRQFDRGAFERSLVEEANLKFWVYHPSQLAETHTQHKELKHGGHARQILKAQPSPSIQRANPLLDSPLVSRFKCKNCGATWYAGTREKNATCCHLCKRHSGAIIG